jgi:hypothetical protein
MIRPSAFTAVHSWEDGKLGTILGKNTQNGVLHAFMFYILRDNSSFKNVNVCCLLKRTDVLCLRDVFECIILKVPNPEGSAKQGGEAFYMSLAAPGWGGTAGVNLH